MADNVPSTILSLNATDEVGDQVLVGRVEYGPNGQLKLLAAVPERKAQLARMVQDLNAKTLLSVRVAPSENSPDKAIATRPVQRSDDDFLSALQTYLQKYYGLSLS